MRRQEKATANPILNRLEFNLSRALTYDSLYAFKIIIPTPVGGEVTTDYLQVLTPLLLYGAAVTIGLITLTKI
jgi:hypothetical protein